MLQIETCPSPLFPGKDHGSIAFAAEVVNDNIPAKQCSKELHAKRRKERSTYCIDCGEQLIPGR